MDCGNSLAHAGINSWTLPSCGSARSGSYHGRSRKNFVSNGPFGICGAAAAEAAAGCATAGSGNRRPPAPMRRVRTVRAPAFVMSPPLAGGGLGSHRPVYPINVQGRRSEQGWPWADDRVARLTCSRREPVASSLAPLPSHRNKCNRHRPQLAISNRHTHSVSFSRKGRKRAVVIGFVTCDVLIFDEVSQIAMTHTDTGGIHTVNPRAHCIGAESSSAVYASAIAHRLRSRLEGFGFWVARGWRCMALDGTNRVAVVKATDVPKVHRRPRNASSPARRGVVGAPLTLPGCSRCRR